MLTNEEAIKVLKELKDCKSECDFMCALYDSRESLCAQNIALDLAIQALEQQRWIPIKTRPLTEEEKEHFISIGWSDDSLEFIYNCPLPDDGQEVLITDSMGNVELDTFYSDDGCYFENNCDADEVVAWMPLPQPYKEGDKE